MKSVIWVIGHRAYKVNISHRVYEYGYTDQKLMNWIIGHTDEVKQYRPEVYDGEIIREYWVEIDNSGEIVIKI